MGISEAEYPALVKCIRYHDVLQSRLHLGTTTNVQKKWNICLWVEIENR